MDKITYDEVINRLQFFRTKANLSARETSLRLGYTEQFIKRIEHKDVQLKVSTLLDFLDIVDVSAEEFFYLGKNYNKEDKNILKLYSKLSWENKQRIIDLMKNLK